MNTSAMYRIVRLAEAAKGGSTALRWPAAGVASVVACGGHGGSAGPSDGGGPSPDASSGVDGATSSDAADEPVVGGDAGPLPLVCPDTDTRPQLTDTQAATATVLSYLAHYGVLTSGLATDSWDPTAGVGDVSTFVPGYTVAATGTPYTTVQSAVDAAVAGGGTNRVYIAVSPGTYREVVCVPTTAPPITLYSTNADATQTVIVFDNYNGETKTAGVAANAC